MTIGNISFETFRPAVGITDGLPRQGFPKQTGGETPVDRVSISEAGRAMQTDLDAQPAAVTDQEQFSPEQQQKIDQLKQRDQEVKAHESAHMAAGGDLVQGGASYTYQQGPDGKNYAVGGEVQIYTSKEQTLEATIEKMQRVRRAALAPVDPSPTDRAVAAQAAQVESQARVEKSREETNPDQSTANDAFDRMQHYASARGHSPYQSDRIESTISIYT